MESGLIGRSDEYRTQTALKHAGCFDGEKYLCCAALANQVHTRIVSKNVDMKNSLILHSHQRSSCLRSGVDHS